LEEEEKGARKGGSWSGQHGTGGLKQKILGVDLRRSGVVWDAKPSGCEISIRGEEELYRGS